MAEGATYDGFSLVIGGRICRTELHAALAGPNATAHLNGAQLLAGSQHGDFTSIVRHAEPHGTLARGYQVSQGREIGHDARLIVQIDGTGIWVGGRSHTVVDGTLDWEPQVV